MARNFSSADALLAPPSSDGVDGLEGLSSKRRSSLTARMTTTLPFDGAACAAADGVSICTSLRPIAQPVVIIATAANAAHGPAFTRNMRLPPLVCVWTAPLAGP